MDVNLTVVLLSVFLVIAAFFSVSETAFFSLQSVRVHHLVESGAPNAQRLAKLKERPERFLSTVLFGNNLCNTAITALATMLALQLFGAEQQGLSVMVSTAAVTVGITCWERRPRRRWVRATQSACRCSSFASERFLTACCSHSPLACIP